MPIYGFQLTLVAHQFWLVVAINLVLLLIGQTIDCSTNKHMIVCVAYSEMTLISLLIRYSSPSLYTWARWIVICHLSNRLARHTEPSLVILDQEAWTIRHHPLAIAHSARSLSVSYDSIHYVSAPIEQIIFTFDMSYVFIIQLISQASSWRQIGLFASTPFKPWTY